MPTLLGTYKEGVTAPLRFPPRSTLAVRPGPGPQDGGHPWPTRQMSLQGYRSDKVEGSDDGGVVGFGVSAVDGEGRGPDGRGYIGPVRGIVCSIGTRMRPVKSGFPVSSTSPWMVLTGTSSGAALKSPATTMHASGEAGRSAAASAQSAHPGTASPRARLIEIFEIKGRYPKLCHVYSCCFLKSAPDP
ncbi:MAG: hypothetical protein JWO49_1210 [Arthrobacter sp.]|nr:hypothetical protein [Arthrobacter sp.]MCU1548622.1 hypothetical protein [Arthrobacter sp.]